MVSNTINLANNRKQEMGATRPIFVFWANLNFMSFTSWLVSVSVGIDDLPPPPPEPAEYSNIPGDFPPPPSPVSSSYSELRRATYQTNPPNHSNYNADYGVYGTSSQVPTVLPVLACIFATLLCNLIFLSFIPRRVRPTNPYMSPSVQDLLPRLRITPYTLHTCRGVRLARRSRWTLWLIFLFRAWTVRPMKIF